MTTSYVSEQMRNEWAKNKLTRVNCTGEIVGFRLADPNLGRIQSCMILFTPEGIVILGDWCPGGGNNGGIVSNFGYGLKWFSNPLSEDYLCEKFMHKEYSAKAAREAIRDRLAELEEDYKENGQDTLGKTPQMGVYEEALGEAEDDFDSEDFGTPERFSVLVSRAQDSDGMLQDGYPEAYPARDAEVLCAIQQRFVQAYAELLESEHVAASAGAEGR